MEVHAHTHTARKKWTHYLWEFLMLFLAVFCGFLAELQLEHQIEKTREKEYILSMIEDLQKDTANFNIVSNDFHEIETRLDSLIAGFDKATSRFNSNWVSDFMKSIKNGYTDFVYTDRTIQQLTNSGGMRLIKRDAAAKGIISYDAAIKDLYIELNMMSAGQENYIKEVFNNWSQRYMYRDLSITNWDRKINYVITKNYWTTTDSKAFDQLYNKMVYYYEMTLLQTRLMVNYKKQAIDLIALLKNEYHLK